MKTLWLHIGMAKTASSSIQTFCHENAGVLERYGFCYPTFPFRYPGVAKAHNGCFLLYKLMDQNRVRDLAQEEKNFKEGMLLVRGLFDKYDNILFSNESIWRGMDREKKNFWELMAQEAEKNDFQIRVIVYLRRQDKFLPSNWNQLVKKKWSEETFEHYTGRANRIFLDYYDKLERMASVVGKENITVRRFERGRFEGGSIYSDFLLALGLSLTDEFRLPEAEKNSGLYGNTHEIKRVLNSLPEIKDRNIQLFILECLREFSNISQKEYPNSMFSEEETADLLDTYGPGNRKVAEEYLHEPGAELFDNTVEQLPKWKKDNPHMEDDVIRFIGAMGAHLYKENQELKKELHELKKFANFVRHPIRTIRRR